MWINGFTVCDSGPLTMATQCATVVLNEDYTMSSTGPLTMASQCGSQWSFICPLKQQQKELFPALKTNNTTQHVKAKSSLSKLTTSG